MSFEIHCADVRQVEIPVVDAIVTDPDFGQAVGNRHRLGDSSLPEQASFWFGLGEKMPSGLIFSFGAPRTVHRMTVAIEDAGFEILDQIIWLHGNGMPRLNKLKPAFLPIVVARSGNAILRADRGQLENGRKSPNVALDQEAAHLLDQETAHLKPGGSVTKSYEEHNNTYGDLGPRTPWVTYGDSGGASRFYYCSKASPTERNLGLPSNMKNDHPTVKPIDLMRWICRMAGESITILDPFMGSGSTGCAAILEGQHFVGSDIDNQSYLVAGARLAYWQQLKDTGDIINL